MRVIIPCAGFGTRMGCKPNESKEMLIYGECPIIQYSLEVCRYYNLDPLIILREEKQDLIEYLRKRKVNYIIVKPEGEWYNTVLMSKGHWNEDNILMLPDTLFKDDCIVYIKENLTLGNKAVFAIHQVDDPENWGIIKDYRLVEKPKNLTGLQSAWGLIGFKYDYGIELFSSMGKGSLKLKDTGFVDVYQFQDVTRGKSNVY